MLAKQALWQVDITLPKEIHHPHFDVSNTNLICFVCPITFLKEICIS